MSRSIRQIRQIRRMFVDEIAGVGRGQPAA